MTDWKASLKATGVGTLGGVAIGLAAFYYLQYRQQPGMGLVLFVLVPVVGGFCSALVARGINHAVAAAFLSVLFSLVVLIATGREGLLCALLAFPVIAVGLTLGIVLGMIARHLLDRAKNQNVPMGMLLLLGPLLVVAGERVETPTMQQPRREVVETSVLVNAPPEQVWNNILSIDSVSASKPLLMYVGLPIPRRCALQGQGAGAKRTCYFNAGYIEETVTEWRPPYALGLSIDRTHMPGRHWLGFEHADYRLESRANSTLLTRRTVVTSHLQPAWYWSFFERLGVESEHEYVLQDVALRAQR